ncbi:hypothetical protein HDV05_003941 [Chytridiales sp. JEL 0842]|nr:hypothetical protein HDV05_003941 [Chytridiales sp. JEL 0842]
MPSQPPTLSIPGSPSRSSVSGTSASALSDHVRSYQLISVIQTNDLTTILPALRTELERIANTAPPSTQQLPQPPHPLTSKPAAAVVPAYGSPLHLAISICSKHVVTQILSDLFIPPTSPQQQQQSSAVPPSADLKLSTIDPPWVNDQNHPDLDTPLHVAVKLRYWDIVELLLKVPGINDTLKDSQGRTAEELAPGGSRVGEIFKREKLSFIAHTISTIQRHLSTRSPQPIYDTFARSPRFMGYLSSSLLDINAIVDPATMFTVLHVAALEDHQTLVEWALKYGADPDCKDKKGRKAIDLLKKDSRLKESLKLAMQSPVVPAQSVGGGSTQPPKVTGTLKKWVNFSTGWKPRFFVLEKGSLSYYKNESEYPSTCRGSISTRVVTIEFPEKDKSRFDVVGKGSVRYSLHAKTPADAKKWVWAIMESKRWMSEHEGKPEAFPTLLASDAVEDNSDDEDGDKPSSGLGSKRNSMTLPPPSSLAPGYNPLDHTAQSAFNSRQNSMEMLAPTSSDDPLQPGSHPTTVPPIPVMLEGAVVGDYMPLTNTDDLSTLAYLLRVQMDVQQRVVEAVVDSLTCPPASLRPRSQSTNNNNNAAAQGSPHPPGRPVSTLGVPTQAPPTTGGSLLRDVDVTNLPSLLQSSMKQVVETVGKIVHLAETREAKWTAKHRKDVEKRKQLEGLLRGMGAGGRVDAGLGGGPVMFAEFEPAVSVKDSETTNYVEAYDTSTTDDDDDDDEDEDLVFYDATDADGRPSLSGLRSPTKTPTVHSHASIPRQPTHQPSLSRSTPPPPAYTDTDHPPKQPPPTTSLAPLFPTPADLESTSTGYPPHPRPKLPFDPTLPKPSFNMWSFLKSAIGKDLSKVTLPVLFNEPISMLQRMAEDVEYIELLSVASRVGCAGGKAEVEVVGDPGVEALKVLGVSVKAMDALKGEEARWVRLLYVAAFAMSNYSSTVGRTGKPFNPLLGETFELYSPEKKFRYVSEQVCHHPPISACYADSPSWTFWTEVNVKSKFWGSSLELHPLGSCHVRLPIAPSASSSISSNNPNANTEHYTWRKVTTTVNNLIVGKLNITHLGDMVIRNWRTGDEVVLTFKPKSSSSSSSWFGWGGSNPEPSSSSSSSSSAGSLKKSKHPAPATAPEDDSTGEIVGVLKDAQGNIRWRLSGSWGSTLTATPTTPIPHLPNPLPLWRRTPPPPWSPTQFNQTSFAMNLNHLPDSLVGYLPPTDSRLRPDQKAMEQGQWDAAHTFKEKLETVQRLRRKHVVSHFEKTGIPNGPKGVKGEGVIAMGESWWVPRWFVRRLDADTGEEHWEFRREYWDFRKEGRWPEWVLPIFEEPEKEGVEG